MIQHKVTNVNLDLILTCNINTWQLEVLLTALGILITMVCLENLWKIPKLYFSEQKKSLTFASSNHLN